MDFQIDWEPAAVNGGVTMAVVTAAANRPLWIRQLVIGFEGITAADVPLEVQILRASAAGTGSARTLVLCDPNEDSAIQATGLTVMTVEPTYTTLIFRAYLHNQTPPLIWQPPDPKLWRVLGGTMVGVRVVGTATPDVDCVGCLTLTE